ncbi:MAG TPA: gamma-glutamyl-gamma-aminobutyrate hydrolase family protein [Phenylobacterium sp.]|jgi:putative glutamine amidotransferase|nr:gamma-glutamyl-gamma-aminobutyrate hydrolase family protein [Phenylobacterium sp.]
MDAVSARPRIAVLLDENTSGDGRRYEAAKGYFEGVHGAGGVPFGIPYLEGLAEVVVRDFDGVLLTGGRYASPAEWYLGTRRPAPPAHARTAVETRIVLDCLRLGRPLLGICAGMQLLAGLSGCRLRGDIASRPSCGIDHTAGARGHIVRLAAESRLRRLVGRSEIHVNSFHEEAVSLLSPGVRLGAVAEDGVIEAIEVCAHPFAMGIQWHQELLVGVGHPGDGVFQGLVDAARTGSAGRRRASDARPEHRSEPILREAPYE